MPNFSESLGAEIADLDAQLRNDPRYVKLAALRELQSLYPTEGAQTSAAAPVSSNSPVPVPPRSDTPSARRAPSPNRVQAINAAKEFVRGKNYPTRTSIILAHIQEQGIEVGGANPLSNLSAMLSLTPGFTPHGRNGWTLEDESPSATAPEQDTPQVSEEEPEEAI